jgi:uncharacterized protein (TIGR03435 family)
MPVIRKTTLLLHLLCASAFAQPASFEVADVRLSPPTLDYHRREMGGPSIAGDQLYIHRATVLNLIALAWKVRDAKVLGGPAWINFDRFDIRAKVPQDSKFDTLRPMLQALLAERFGLEVHEGSKEMPGWALTAAKTTQLKPPADSSQRGCRIAGNGPGSDGAIVLNCSGLSMEQLAAELPGGTDYIDGQYTVEDRTGLTGDWAFTLRFAPSKSAALSNHSPTLFEALDQIGLKLEPAPVTIKGIVVDRVNRQPAANPANVAAAFPAGDAAFEVVVVKPIPAGDRTLNNAYTAADNTRVQYLQGGRVNIQGSLQGLVRWTFGINMVRVVGMPAWATEDSWDISAKPPHATNDSDTISEMLRSLLTERFGMKFHFEKRPIASYTLVADKPKLKAADPAGRTGCREGALSPSRLDARDKDPLLSRLITCRNITMSEFASLLFKGMASGYVGGPVFDATGLEGRWDFAVNFSPAPPVATAQPPAGTGDSAGDPAGAVTLSDAIRKQLGIRMEMQKQPVEVLVIDHLERKPTEN